MIINYDIQKIDDALQDFYNATGINIQIIKEDFSPLATNLRAHNNYCSAIQACDAGRKACGRSDIALLEKCKSTKKAQMHICHAGLIDVAVPILYDNLIPGYIILGQMKKETDFSKISDKISHLPTDAAKMEGYYSKLPYFDDEKIHSIANIATMLAKYILLENMLNPRLITNIEKATEFIDVNLEKDMTIKEICESTNISKSVLYKNFHSYFSCTVNDYINTRRVEKSIELLEKTDLSIEEISQKVGFSSASYFSRIFKSKKGISPLRFKRQKTGL